jgi:hypothetical protein
MVSGLTGTFSRHTHFFTDLVRSLKAEALARVDGSPTPETTVDEADVAADSKTNPANDKELVSKLEARNREVIAHEATHMAAAGGYIKGAASYTYQIGPDGKPYAIGGEVSIDMSPVPGNLRATITKMMAIRAAALSPSDPSGQDMSVAAAAAQIEAQARAQLNQSSSNNTTPAQRAVAGSYGQSAASAGAFVNAFA